MQGGRGSSCGGIRLSEPRRGRPSPRRPLYRRIRLKRAASHDAGGCSFAPDPDLRADQTFVFWRPDLLTDLVRLLPATASPFEARLRFDPARWRARHATRAADDGVHLIIGDPAGEHRLWLPGPELPALGTPLAVVLDSDRYAQERADAALRFWRFAAEPRVARGLPPAPSLSNAGRLARMLWAIDLRAAENSHRQIAADMLGIAQSSDWADHSDRSHVRRLIRDAAAIVNGRYRDLLRPPKRLLPAVTR